jgi:hypothetical protein
MAIRIVFVESVYQLKIKYTHNLARVPKYLFAAFIRAHQQLSLAQAAVATIRPAPRPGAHQLPFA